MLHGLLVGRILNFGALLLFCHLISSRLFPVVGLVDTFKWGTRGPSHRCDYMCALQLTSLKGRILERMGPAEPLPEMI